MTQEPTKAQYASSNPKNSVWVTANAGTGKTKVLINRVLRLMLNGTRPSRILCLTFTKAATMEMLSRIDEELSNWAISEENDLINDIKKLTGNTPDKETLLRARTLFTQVVDGIDELKIQTIHSFCESLLKRFPLEAGLSPHFQVMDERTVAELINEAWTRILSKTEEEMKKDKELYDAIKTVCLSMHNITLDKIINQIVEKKIKFQHDINNKGGIISSIDKLYKKLGVTKGLKEEDIISDKSFNKGKLKLLADVLAVSYEERSRAMDDFISNGKSFEQYVNIFLTKEGKRKQISKIITKKLIENFPDAEDVISSEQERLEGISEKIKSLKTAKLSESLIYISEALLWLYRYLKQAKNFLDYDDLILTSNRLLSKPDISAWIMYKLDEGIDHLLIDEAQDTSLEQWKIIKQLSEEFFAGESAKNIDRTIFVVGDEKQSIFSFQGADLSVFEHMRNFFSNAAVNAKKGWEHISLEESFRSTEPILKLVDTIFNDEEIKNSVSLSSTKIEHDIHRKGEAGKVELWPLVTVKEEKKPEEIWPIPTKVIKKNDPSALLAKHIAKTIKTWLDDKRELQSKGRPITAGDIVILVRNRSNFGENLAKYLKNQNIPIAGIDRMILTNHISVMDLIALGNFLLLPTDDLTLATILKSPLIRISEDELYDLSYEREGFLWDSLKQKSNDKEIYKKAYEYLSILLEKAGRLSPFELYSEILEVMGGRKDFISRLGYEVNDPLDEFINLTILFSNSHTPTLQGFLHWIENGKTEIKRDLEHDNDEVRIMTVHGAKGLQAPIVILPGTIQPLKSPPQIIWSDDGFMLWNGKKEDQNRFCKTLNGKIKKNGEDEENRLLYVALTRAEDELYVCGWEGRNSLPENCWYNTVKNSMAKIGEKFSYSINGESLEAIKVNSKQENEEPYKQIESEENVLHIEKLPDFLLKKAPNEEQETNLSPSKISNERDDLYPPLKTEFYERGKVIHSLLQFIPEMNPKTMSKDTKNLLDVLGRELKEKTKKEILSEVLTVINHHKFSEVFGKDSKSEVPVSGKIGSNIISGQIDRLVVKEKEVMIIDYKTNRKPPKSEEKTNPIYLKQMATYRDIMQLIYPDKKIICALLWTANMTIITLSDKLLNLHSLTSEQPIPKLDSIVKNTHGG